MKKTIISVMTLLAALSAGAVEQQALVLHASTGGEVVYFLDRQPVVTIEGANAVVTSAGKADEYPMDGIESMTVEMRETDGVVAAQAANGPSVLVTRHDVTVINPAGGQVRVYTLNGTLAATAAGEVCRFELQRGVYVITVGAKSFKIKF